MAKWQFSDTASLKVGKDYSPVTDNNMSNQVFDSDNDLYGNGLFYGRRPCLHRSVCRQLRVCRPDPHLRQMTRSAPPPSESTAPPGGDPDAYFPKLEAAYNFKFSAGYIRPFAGFQWYKDRRDRRRKCHQTTSTWCTAYVLGASSQVNIGAFYANARIRVGRELELIKLVARCKRGQEQPALFKNRRR